MACSSLSRCSCSRQLGFELGDLAVAQLGRALQIGVALGALGVAVRLLESLLRFADRGDRLLLGLPAGLHLAGALAQVRQLALDRLAARDRRIVTLLLQRVQLDLELLDAALDLVDLGRHRVDLDAEARRGLVDQVDCLVGEEAVGDVAGGQQCSRDDRGVLDAHAVVHLVALLQPAQDRDRVLDRRLTHEHGLEAPLQSRVFFYVLAVLVERGRADRAQLAAREHRLQQVRGVHGALGRAGADDRVQLVHEQDDPALGLLHLLQHRLQPVLELAAVLRAGDQRADVERDDAAVAQGLGDVARHDALREALDDRRLADARVADQHGVVLRAPRQHLDHAPDLLVAADHRVELALLRGLGEVTAEALERLVLVLRIGVGHAVRAAHLAQRRENRVAVGRAPRPPRPVTPRARSAGARWR